MPCWRRESAHTSPHEDRHLQHQQHPQPPAAPARVARGGASPTSCACRSFASTTRSFRRSEIAAAGYGAIWQGRSPGTTASRSSRAEREPVEIRRGLARRSRRRAGALSRSGRDRHRGRVPVRAERQSAARTQVRLQARVARAPRDARGVAAFVRRAVVLAGDYNVVPTPADIYATTSYDDDALVQPESRAAFRVLLDQGWIDAIRPAIRPRRSTRSGITCESAGNATPGCASTTCSSTPRRARLAEANVDRAVRGRPGASDHAPAWIEIRQPPRKARAKR